jgi:hypothetical protein
MAVRLREAGQDGFGRLVIDHQAAHNTGIKTPPALDAFHCIKGVFTVKTSLVRRVLLVSKIKMGKSITSFFSVGFLRFMFFFWGGGNGRNAFELG